jgi:hypothetical protein
LSKIINQVLTAIVVEFATCPVHDSIAVLPHHILLGEPARGLLKLPEREPMAPPEVRHLRPYGGAPRRAHAPLVVAELACRMVAFL